MGGGRRDREPAMSKGRMAERLQREHEERQAEAHIHRERCRSCSCGCRSRKEVRQSIVATSGQDFQVSQASGERSMTHRSPFSS
jgi:hypothetical protein